jgi:alpha-L-rhamnosidase
MVGWCRFNFHGPRGLGIYIRHAEVLAQPVVSSGQAHGGIYTENLRGATQTDNYILSGDPNGETYEPRFTVHGFRYISVFGSPHPLTVNDVQCLVVHSETTVKGHFSSSNPVINQIQHNVQWGQLSNSMSLPTDCPQRDERKGWMGDASLTVNEALYNFDLIKFYLNFLNLIADIQLPDGSIADTVPVTFGGYPADPNWGTALPTITWQLYRHYNDPQILKDHYSVNRAYIESVRAGYTKTGLANLAYHYGDWVPPPPEHMTNVHLIASFGFLHDVSLLINMSQVIGFTNDTQSYTTFYQQLAQEFHRVFFTTASGYYADGMQAAQILALALPNVVPADVRDGVFKQLTQDIAAKGNHVSTGISSTAQLFPLLSDNGQHDLAVELVSSITYPSYGYMFNNPYENATTMWELWDAPMEGPGMNSRNHHMFSSIGAWFYSHLAGIDFQSDLILIRPRMLSENKKQLLSKIDAQLSTLYGLVHVSYTRDEKDTFANSILLRVKIPTNANAKVILEPLFRGARCVTLTEGNEIIWSNDVKKNNVLQDPQTGLMTVHIGSGEYQYQAFWE